jgi:hypothetical protein
MKNVKFEEEKPRWTLIMFWILIVIGSVTQIVSESKAETGRTFEKATVRTDKATIFSQMSTDSKVVTSLAKGEEVVIKLKIEGSEGAWCAVAKRDETVSLGYVQCKHLAPEESRKESWQLVGSSVIKTGIETTKIMVARNAVLVPVTIAYKGKEVNVPLLLDTGSSRTMVSTEIAGRLNMNLAESRKGRVQVVGGALIEAQQVRLDYITVGPHTKKDAEILVVEHNGPPVKHAGLLGMDLLSGLKYNLDLEKQIIRWE